MKRIHSLLIFLLMGYSIYTQTAGRQSTNSGSGEAVAAGFAYSYTIGEAISGTSSSGTVVLTKGMQQPQQAGGLPIELLAFTARLQESVAHLSWQTNLEIQSDYFVIERSIDGLTYEVIGNMDAAGYSDSPLDYRFTDIQIASLGVSVVFYRLRQYDLDGAFSLSPTVQISLAALGTSTSSLFPNPASTEAFLRYQTTDAHSPQLRLTDVHGKLLSEKKLPSGAGVQSIRVEPLAEGTYFVTFSVGIYRKTHRLIVTH